MQRIFYHSSRIKVSTSSIFHFPDSLLSHYPSRFPAYFFHFSFFILSYFHFPTHYSLLTTPYSQFPIPRSRITHHASLHYFSSFMFLITRSLFTIPYSLLPFHDSRLTISDSLLPIPFFPFSSIIFHLSFFHLFILPHDIPIKG